jgi:hypothetical protein
MADVYGVTPADIAAELSGIMPDGFAVSTLPTLGQVTSFITAMDLAVAVAVQNASGAVPSATDRLAPLAKRVIIDRVKALVIRVVYGGNDIERVDAAAAPYERSAAVALKSITDLETQAAGAGEPANRVISSATPTRELLVTDDDLGLPPHRAGWSSSYPDRGSRW